MMLLFQEVLEELRELGVNYVGLDAGDERQHLHRRDLLVRIAPPDAVEINEIRDCLDDVEKVHWQGQTWGFAYGVSPRATAESDSTHHLYVRGRGIALESLHDAYRERGWKSSRSIHWMN